MCSASCSIFHALTNSILTHIEFHITELASPARSLDLQNGLSVSIHDGEPGVDKGAVLCDVANGISRRGLYLHFLQATEAAPTRAAKRTHQVNYLFKSKSNIHLRGKLSLWGSDSYAPSVWIVSESLMHVCFWEGGGGGKLLISFLGGEAGENLLGS